MTNNDYTEQDELWTSLQRMFSPDDALIFRNYPIRVENSVREIDYFLFLRSGTVLMVLVEPVEQQELETDEQQITDGLTIRDEFSGETRTYYPTAIARSFLFALRQQDLPINDELIIIWLPNISRNTNIAHYLPNNLNNENVIVLFGTEITARDIRNAFRHKLSDQSDRRISYQGWLNLKARLNPPSPIQSRTPKIDRAEQMHLAMSLSERYIHAYRKSTLIFISYRRDDAGWPAGRIYSHLSSLFDGNIFFDYESIKPGADWMDAIDQALDDCIVQLVIMGPKWANLKKRGSKIPRILEPKDMVAHEIRTALRKKVITIPLMIDHNRMPYGKQLPTGLRSLPRKNAMVFNQDNYFAKIDVLLDRIIELLAMAIP
jgi:hypothetical protein